MRHAKKAATKFVQNSHDAMTKGMHGSHLVYKNDGSPVEDNPWRTGKEGRTCTASAYGRRSVSRHVASYSAVQLASTFAVTRVLGYRVPASALLTGVTINAITTESWTGATRCSGSRRRLASPATSSTPRSSARPAARAPSTPSPSRTSPVPAPR